MRTYAVDRLEGKSAVLVADDGSTIDVPRSQLPRVREGSVLRVRLGANGSPTGRALRSIRANRNAG